MKATSVQVIKNVKDICFSIDDNPTEMESKLTIVVSTNDDIFEFDFEGPDLIQRCKAPGLFTGWEKDQKIKELEKENKQNKEAADCWSNEYYNLSKRFDKLQEMYKSLEDHGCHVLLHGMDFTPDELVNRILELEKMKTPTIENFADEEPADNVNHPSHYTGKYECIDVMQDVFGDEATNNFCLCNAFKYIWRARKKNGLEDVKKAVWYLNKYVEEAEKDGEDEVAGT